MWPFYFFDIIKMRLIQFLGLRVFKVKNINRNDNSCFYCNCFCVGPPEITNTMASYDTPKGTSVDLMCTATGMGPLSYKWERRISSGRWTTIENADMESYTTDTKLNAGSYTYRCTVTNTAGSDNSNIAIINVYGECCTCNLQTM